MCGMKTIYDPQKRRERYLRNRDAERATMRAYYERNREHLKAKTQKRYREMTPEERSEYHRTYNLRRLYGMTVAEYEARLEAQGGVCALCHEPPRSRRLAVDHCHDTGKVRGLLHIECNRSLGAWERINDAARAYLGLA
jgi:hypothetical protein